MAEVTEDSAKTRKNAPDHSADIRAHKCFFSAKKATKKWKKYKKKKNHKKHTDSIKRHFSPTAATAATVGTRMKEGMDGGTGAVRSILFQK